MAKRMQWNTILLPLLFFFANCQVEELNCEGGFDVYMIVDQSNSVGAEGVSSIANFTLEVKNRYQERPGFRMAIYTFGSVAFPVLPLTSDLSIVDTAIEVMRTNVVNSGFTQMEKGMEFAVSEMSKPENANRNKLMFLLTDGQMTSLQKDAGGSYKDSSVVFWANEARKVRCTVISLGVGNQAVLDIDLLRNAANKNESGSAVQFWFTVPDFNVVSSLLDQFQIGTSCVNLTTLLIDCGPLVAGTNITIAAKDITDFLFRQTVTQFECGFEWYNNNSRRTPATVHLDTETLTCLSPDEDIDNTTTLKILYDGKSFGVGLPLLISGSQNPLCLPVIVAPVPFPWYLLLIAAILLLFLLWFFFPKMPAKKVFEDPTEEFSAPQIQEEINVAPISPPVTPLPPPSLPPPKEKKKIRKWAKVDTSHYIWARDGGTARPMEVAWGGTGAPESAPAKKGDVVYTVESTPKPVVVEEPKAAEPMVSKPEIEEDYYADDEGFEDREWGRCCCGLCSSNACSCCKNLMMRSFFCCGFAGRLCGNFCKPCAGIYNCCNKFRPRWDCCGVGKGDTADGRGRTFSKMNSGSGNNLQMDNNPVAN